MTGGTPMTQETPILPWFETSWNSWPPLNSWTFLSGGPVFLSLWAIPMSSLKAKHKTKQWFQTRNGMFKHLNSKWNRKHVVQHSHSNGSNEKLWSLEGQLVSALPGFIHTDRFFLIYKVIETTKYMKLWWSIMIYLLAGKARESCKVRVTMIYISLWYYVYVYNLYIYIWISL